MDNDHAYETANGLPTLNFLDALKDAGKLKTSSDRTRFTVVGYGVDPGDNKAFEIRAGQAACL